MKAYHICHHNDEDGLASASVIYEYLKRVSKRARYFFYELDYTMDLQKVLPESIPEGDEVYFLDYSFSNIDNFNYMLELSNKGIFIRWIDHHKTSYDIVNGLSYKFYPNDYPNLYYYIDTNYCGAYLSYIYAYSKLKYDKKFEITIPDYIPLYIKYVDSWDTWKHNMPDTADFNIAINSIKRTPKNTLGSILKYNISVINKLFSDNIKDIEVVESHMNEYINNLINTGKVLTKYQNSKNETLCEDYGFEFNIIDDFKRVYKCFAVNGTGNSLVFGERINEYNIVILVRFNGIHYIYSLYTNKENVDCCVLAKKFGSIDGLGGGGHVKAAGFQAYHQILNANCDIYLKNKLFNMNKYKIKKSFWRL